MEKDTLLVIKNKKITGEIAGEVYVDEDYWKPIDKVLAEYIKKYHHEAFSTVIRIEDEKEIEKAMGINIEKTVLYSVKLKKFFKVWARDFYASYKKKTDDFYTVQVSEIEDENEDPKPMSSFINPKHLLVYYL